MQHKIIHLHQTASTNDYLRTLQSPQDDSMTVVYADWQTAGRGQGSNKWESEAGKNLLFSILVCVIAYHWLKRQQKAVLHG